MALVTLCPGCRTTFRVTAKQLKAHGGDVRCGQCHQVFNSFATLITVDESEIGDSSGLVSELLSEKKLYGLSDSEVNPILPDDSKKTLALYLNPEPGSEPAPAPDPAFNFDASSQRKNQLFWIPVGLSVLIISLVLAGFLYRTEIAAAKPEARPFLERFCVLFLCTVPYPQDITLLSIESSDLQVDEETIPNVASLTAIIRNHAPYPQVLPMLRLTLTDHYNQVVASRYYTVDDYLNNRGEVGHFIGSKDEKIIEFNVKYPDLNATGYQLLLEYP